MFLSRKNKGLLFIKAGLLFFLLIAAVFIPPAECAVAEFDEKLINLSNEAMSGIYEEILSQKEKYKELAAFDETVLSRNKYGIYVITYKYDVPANRREMDTFEFMLTLENITDPSVKERGAFNLPFPFLGIKFNGYLRKGLSHRLYSLREAMSKRSASLNDYQQQFLPLKLTLSTKKEIFNVGENIYFEAKLVNVTNHHMFVRVLDGQTVSCFYDNREWEATSEQNTSSKEIKLMASEFLTQGFIGGKFSRPIDFNLSCRYNMNLQGVQPVSNNLKIRVVNNEF